MTKLSEVKAGDTLIADAGFTCIKVGEYEVKEGRLGLFVSCSNGEHYIDGDVCCNTDSLIGWKLKA